MRPPSSLGWTLCLLSPGLISMTDRGELPLGATLPSCYCGGQQSFEPKTKTKNQTNNKLKLEKRIYIYIYLRERRQGLFKYKKEPRGGAKPCPSGPGPWSPRRMEGRMLLSLHKYLMDVVFGKAGGGRLGQGLSLSQGGWRRVGRAERGCQGLGERAPCSLPHPNQLKKL